MSNLKPFLGLAKNIFKGCQTTCSFNRNGLLKPVKSDLFNFVPFLNLHTTTPRNITNVSREKQRAIRAAQKMDKGLKGSDSPLLDSFMKSKEDMFPTIDLPNRLFNGVPFKNVPIANIKVSKNNTIISLSDKGDVKVVRSCGCEGFKNCKKGTNVAAQVTGVAFGMRAVKKGYKDIRLVIQGVGPGRMGIVKGLQLSGMNIISITDTTINSSSQRPKKERRL